MVAIMRVEETASNRGLGKRMSIGVKVTHLYINLAAGKRMSIIFSSGGEQNLTPMIMVRRNRIFRDEGSYHTRSVVISRRRADHDVDAELNICGHEKSGDIPLLLTLSSVVQHWTYNGRMAVPGDHQGKVPILMMISLERKH